MNSNLGDFVAFLICLVALIIVGIIDAHAGEITVSPGVTYFRSVPNNTWYNNSAPHELNLKSESIALEWNSDPIDGWRYGASIAYYGRVSSLAAINNLDEDEQRYHGCNPVTGCLPWQFWKGHGSVSGLTAHLKTPAWRSLRAIIGITTIFSTWHMEITGQAVPAPYVFRSDRKTRSDLSFALEYQFDRHWSARITEFVSNNRESGIINYREVPAHQEYTPSITRGYSTNLSLGYTF